MDIKISYRHLESSPAVEEKIRNKVEKLKKFFHGKMTVEWICAVDSHDHSSEVTVSGDHFSVHASAKDTNLYKTLDEAMSKLEKQLAKKSEQVKDKIHR